MVPNISIMLMLFNMMLGLLLPVGMMIYFRKKYKVKYKAFFIGVAVMLIFAMILEQLIHVAVLGSSAGTILKNNIWLKGLYGGLMAGIFEEGGRYLAMRFCLKKESNNPHTSLMYGAGHGGFEAFVILTIGMISNVTLSLMINEGQIQNILASLDASAGEQLEVAVDSLVNTPSWQFAISPIERIGAMTAHIGLSVIVWFAVKEAENGIKLLGVAIGLHAALDCLTAVASGIGVNMFVIEAAIYVMAIGICLLARNIWLEKCKDSVETPLLTEGVNEI